MTDLPNERPRGRRALRLLGAAFAAILVTAGVSAVVLESNTEPASATTVSFNQCNAHAAGPLGAALTETCSVTIVNTINALGATSSVSTVRNCTLGGCTGDSVSSSDVVNQVFQCNGSNTEGGSTTICSVNITNNISASAPAAATALVLNQCVGSGGGGGTLMTGCIIHTSGGADVVQCNGSGDHGGGAMTCNASGTVSSDFPVSVNQCNGSETGGGSFVTCTVSMTTNIVDTDLAGPTAGTPSSGTPSSGTPSSGGGTTSGGTTSGGTTSGSTSTSLETTLDTTLDQARPGVPVLSPPANLTG